MRCLSCQYELRNLTDRRCPECGRAFDPDDPRTFETDAVVRERALERAFNALGFCFIGTFVAAMAMNGPGLGVDRVVSAAKIGLFVCSLAVPFVVLTLLLWAWLRKAR